MRTRFALAILILSMASTAFAQTVVTNPAATKLRWDHDGIGIDGGGFKLYTDGGTVGTVLVSTPIGGSFDAPFPALTPGNHQLQVTAFGADTGIESDRSNILEVRVVIVPVPPTNLRLAEAGLGDALVIITAVRTAEGWVPVLDVGQGYYRKA